MIGSVRSKRSLGEGRLLQLGECLVGNRGREGIHIVTEKCKSESVKKEDVNDNLSNSK